MHHPWLTQENGIYVIWCPNAGNLGCHRNAKKTIKCIHSKQKKKQQDFQKRMNLATTNCNDFNDASKERIRQQVLQTVSVTKDATSVSSSITGLTGGASPASAGTGYGCGKPVVFMYDVQVLQTDTKCPTLPVAIQSVMPHIMLQLGLNLNNGKSLSI
jgi:hypothetical protein